MVPRARLELAPYSFLACEHQILSPERSEQNQSVRDSEIGKIG